MRAGAVAALACALAFACADEPTGPPGSFRVAVAAPPVPSLAVGETLRLEAEVRDQWGEALPGVPVTWSSDDPRVASVDPSGAVTAVSPGTATITAASGGGWGTVQLSVADPAYAVLVALYIKTGGGGWTNNENWLTSAPLDAWYGVETDTAGQVVGLSLGGNNLTGHIPPELGDLSSLQDLSLSDNSLTGPIPAELGELDQLNELHLSSNALTGEIPAELGGLDRLWELSLGANNLTGEIPAELGNLGSLEDLRLSNNQLTGEIPPELGNLEDLKFLDLHSNALTGQIPPELGNIGLSQLNLSDNDLSGEIPSELGGIKGLEELWLSHNSLTGGIPPELGGLSDLSTLWLSHNQLSGSLPDELGDLANLAWLLVGDNPLAGPLPLSLAATPLDVLGYADTGLCVPADADFRAWLEGIPHHEGTGVDCTGGNTDRDILEIFYNETDGPNWANNANWLSDAPLDQWHGVTTDSAGRVTWVMLPVNNLVGVLPSELDGLTNLTMLDLSQNRLSGTIPPGLGDLAHLESLNLHNNQLSGAIPLELGSLTSLITLSLEGNSLTGKIPVELGKLVNLSGLWLGRNRVSGAIPPELGDLSNLTWLGLHNNQLSGSIPRRLARLDRLTHLRVAGNDVCVPRSDSAFVAWLDGVNHDTGGLPACPPLSDRDILEILYNATDGPNWTNNTNWLDSTVALGDWYGVATDDGGRVTELRLGRNKLAGDIPPELGGIANLQSLSLFDNQLTGAIPPELGRFANLDQLHLANNDLTGGIPRELGNLANLARLFLAGNDLTGTIPPELGSLADLEELFLGSNQLTGAIPPEFGELANLRRLSLPHTALTGAIPPQLGSLANLRELTLHDNPLSGPLPLELAGLSLLEAFWYHRTDLCVPADESFRGWLNAIESHLGTGVDCAAPQSDRDILEILYNATDGPNWTNNTNWLDSTVALGEWHGVDTDAEGRVTKLWLYDNNLTGAIPTELGRLVSLQGMLLYRNQLTGAIPVELGGLANLEYLSLSGNQLTGAIPAELGGLANLQSLMLNNNQLVGTIPPELGDLANLTVLELIGNQLTGGIPPELGRLANLDRLYLSRNDLTGAIPPELGHLTNLNALWLYENDLTGGIPPELGGLADLEYVSLDRNQLTGEIPPELGELANLRQLWLRGNQLTGALPPQLGSLANLRALGLSDNPLSGPLPLELAGLSVLDTFWYSRTGLCVPADESFRAWLNAIERHSGTGVDCATSLSALSLSGVTLNPAFSPGTLNYTASVEYDVDETTVDWTANSNAATVSIAPADADTYATGHQVALAVGDNTITVAVTAEDGTRVDYTVTVTRAGGGFRDDFDSSASLADWTIHNADADVGAGVLRLTNRVEDRLGIAERRAPPALAGWTIAARMGRAAREASPGVLWFTGHDRFAALRFTLATRDSTNYESALFDAEADRWVSVTNMSGHSEAVMEDAAAFTDITLGSEGDEFVAYADNDSRDEAAVLFRFDMDDTRLDGVALREFLHNLTGTWLINSGPMDLTSLHDWVEVTGSASGAATAAAAAASHAGPTWTTDVRGAHRVRVVGGGGERGREPH